ncbi:hypothetical protein ACQKJZ_10720 [Sphingomonas sp. NPDC019816]|uniref:hypothetical protein n=1 Tax=Sphingomonas sp. NPDC019816 TaxID=3390679 RepID=UPI003D01BE2B
MLDLSDVSAVRKMLAIMCRNPLLRINPPEINIRNNWRPFDVVEPHSLSFHSDESAWEHIADCLDGNVAVTCQPPTTAYPDHAYVMIEEDGRGMKLYMKIAINPIIAKKVIGVSFHHARR